MLPSPFNPERAFFIPRLSKHLEKVGRMLGGWHGKIIKNSPDHNKAGEK